MLIWHRTRMKSFSFNGVQHFGTRLTSAFFMSTEAWSSARAIYTFMIMSVASTKCGTPEPKSPCHHRCLSGDANDCQLTIHVRLPHSTADKRRLALSFYPSFFRTLKDAIPCNACVHRFARLCSVGILCPCAWVWGSSTQEGLKAVQCSPRYPCSTSRFQAQTLQVCPLCRLAGDFSHIV